MNVYWTLCFHRALSYCHLLLVDLSVFLLVASIHPPLGCDAPYTFDGRDLAESTLLLSPLRWNSLTNLRTNGEGGYIVPLNAFDISTGIFTVPAGWSGVYAITAAAITAQSHLKQWWTIIDGTRRTSFFLNTNSEVTNNVGSGHEYLREGILYWHQLKPDSRSLTHHSRAPNLIILVNLVVFCG